MHGREKWWEVSSAAQGLSSASGTHSPVTPIRQALLLTYGAAEPAVGAEGAVGAWCVAGQEALGPELVPPQVSVGLRTAWLGPGCSRSCRPGIQVQRVAGARDQRVQGTSWTWPASSCFLCCFPSFLVWAEYLRFLARGTVSTIVSGQGPRLSWPYLCHGSGSSCGGEHLR